MRLSFPTTWDDQLLDLVRRHPVFTVYGAMDLDAVGGGKPSAALPRVSRERLSEHVARVKQAGTSFTYLLNPTCLANEEQSPQGQRAIRELLGFLTEIGVDYVAVSLPQLIESVRKHAPALKIRVSTNALVDSPQRARFFAALGASEITLDFHINRDFARLRAIRRAVDLELTLIVNDICLLRCPWLHFHATALGHAAQAGPRQPFVDTYALACKSRQLTDPVELLRAPWIRPEDLARYEELGFGNFKIAGRGKPASFLRRAVEAYAARRWDGNLMELLETVAPQATDEEVRRLDSLLERAPRLGQGALRLGGALLSHLKHSPRGDALVALSRLSPALARGQLRATHALGKATQAVHIDNRALDGFLARFEEGPCGDCERCDWCEGWTQRAVRWDPALSAEAVRLADELRALLS